MASTVPRFLQKAESQPRVCICPLPSCPHLACHKQMRKRLSLDSATLTRSSEVSGRLTPFPRQLSSVPSLLPLTPLVPRDSPWVPLHRENKGRHIQARLQLASHQNCTLGCPLPSCSYSGGVSPPSRSKTLRLCSEPYLFCSIYAIN